jgi:hypothetical protein
MRTVGVLLALVFAGVGLRVEAATPAPTDPGKTVAEWAALAKDKDPALRFQAAWPWGK